MDEKDFAKLSETEIVTVIRGKIADLRRSVEAIKKRRAPLNDLLAEFRSAIEKLERQVKLADQKQPVERLRVIACLEGVEAALKLIDPNLAVETSAPTSQPTVAAPAAKPRPAPATVKEDPEETLRIHHVARSILGEFTGDNLPKNVAEALKRHGDLDTLRLRGWQGEGPTYQEDLSAPRSRIMAYLAEAVAVLRDLYRDPKVHNLAAPDTIRLYRKLNKKYPKWELLYRELQKAGIPVRGEPTTSRSKTTRGSRLSDASAPTLEAAPNDVSGGQATASIN